MARTHVGKFSLTPSPQSNKLYAECARNTEFPLDLALSRCERAFAYNTRTYLPSRIHSFLIQRVFAISFGIEVSRAGPELDCSWYVTGHPFKVQSARCPRSCTISSLLISSCRFLSRVSSKILKTSVQHVYKIRMRVYITYADFHKT